LISGTEAQEPGLPKLPKLPKRAPALVLGVWYLLHRAISRMRSKLECKEVGMQ